MKKLLFLSGLLVIALMSCNDTSSESSADYAAEDSGPTIEGVWELVSYYNYDDDGGIDTIKASATNKQIKMYSRSKIMWSRYNATDSLDWFGFGDYTTTDSSLTEVLDFGSKSMLRVIEEEAEFNFDLVITDSTFSQITIDEDGNPFFAENYKRITENR